MSPTARLLRIKLALLCDDDSRLRRNIRHAAWTLLEFATAIVLGYGILFAWIGGVIWMAQHFK